MAKSIFNRLIKDLNLIVRKNKHLLILILGAIIVFSLARNMFEGESKHSKKEGFAGKREIIYFHMEGCGHCKKFTPEWEKFAQGTDMPNQKVDAGDPLASKMEVSGFPTVLIIEDGKKIDTFKDERTANKLHAFVNKNKN